MPLRAQITRFVYLENLPISCYPDCVANIDECVKWPAHAVLPSDNPRCTQKPEKQRAEIHALIATPAIDKMLFSLLETVLSIPFHPAYKLPQALHSQPNQVVDTITELTGFAANPEKRRDNINERVLARKFCCTVVISCRILTCAPGDTSPSTYFSCISKHALCKCQSALLTIR